MVPFTPYAVRLRTPNGSLGRSSFGIGLLLLPTIAEMTRSHADGKKKAVCTLAHRLGRHAPKLYAVPILAALLSVTPLLRSGNLDVRCAL